MKLDLIAHRYAEAFLEYAKETAGLEKLTAETKSLKKILRANPECLVMLSGSAFSIMEKFEIIDNIFKDYFCPEIIQLLKFTVEKNRAAILPDILNCLIAGYSQSEDTEALIRSAYPLKAKDIREIEERLERKFGKDLNFSIKIDQSLLGGIEVEVGGRMIDGSLKGRLQDLKQEIKGARTG